MGASFVLAFDGLLASLACLLGVHTVVLGASPNDNGLLHQELVDFELPPSKGGWEPIVISPGADEAERRRSRLHDPARCAVPFEVYGAGRPDGAPLFEHWQTSSKFRLLDPLRKTHTGGDDAEEALGIPCALFGGKWPPPGGNSACKSPAGAQPSGLRTCFAWCQGSMSEAHANVSISAHYDYTR